MKRRLFFVHEEINGAAVKSGPVFTPPNTPQRWSVDFWAKSGAFRRDHTLTCDDPMLMAEFHAYCSEELARFMDGAREQYQDTIAALRLNGEFGKAYEIEGKPARHGFNAFVLVD